MSPVIPTPPLAVPRQGNRRGVGNRTTLGYPATAILSALWLVFTAIAFLTFSQDQKRSGSWGCEMSYMWPSYQRIEWQGATNSRYALYLYREAGWDSGVPSGAPVIFIPGNAGSYKQVRSIASSASRQFYGDGGASSGRTKWEQPLDFFAIDFNEDLSAFHAGTLREQAHFLASAASHVLDSYQHLPSAQRPTAVTLLGHSMGGVVARLAASSLMNVTVDAIITMSTPHWLPPLAFESDMDQVFSDITTRHSPSRPLLISICGGVSDTQIVSDSCALSNDMTGSDDGFAVFSTAIPGAWTGVEHQAMVWCHQVRWRVARALLDMNAASTRSSALDMARKWLLGPSSLSDSSASGLSLFEPTQITTTTVDITSTNMTIIVWHSVLSEAMLVDPPIRVRHCSSGGHCDPVSASVRPIPWLKRDGRPFPLPGEGIAPSESAFVVNVDALTPGEGRLEVDTPKGWSLVGGSHLVPILDASSWVPPVSSSPTHVSLRFQRPLLSSILAWRLKVKTEECAASHVPTVHYESQPAQGYERSVESRFYPVIDDTITATLHSHISGAPFQGRQQQSRGITVSIYQHPQCPVTRVDLSIDWGASLAKAVLRLRIAVVTWCLGWVAVILFQQLQEYRSSGEVRSMSLAIEGRIVPNLGCAGVVLATSLVAQYAANLIGGPAEQLFLGFTHPLMLPLSLLAACWSYGTVVVVQSLLSLLVNVTGRLWRQADRPTDAKPSSSQWPTITRLLSSFVLLVLVSLTIPYRMAFVILFLVQFMIVSRSGTKMNSRHNLSFTALTLMAMLLPLNLPAVIVWGRDVWAHYGHPFRGGHAIIPLLPAFLLVELCSVERDLVADKRIISVAQGAAALLACVSFVLAPRRPYLLLPTANVVLLALCGLFVGGRRQQAS